MLGGDERQRRGGHHARDRRELVRRVLGRGDEPDDHLGRGRQQQHPADDRAELVQTELEPGRDAEVAAAAADRPEQVRMRLGIDAQEPTVRGHDLGREQVVDREAVLADEVADAAAQRDPADSDRARIAESGREPVRRGRRRVLARGQARLGPRGAVGGIDLERPQLGEIEHDPALGDAVSRAAVTAAADRELEP